MGEGRYAFRIDGKGLRGIRGDSIYFPAVSRKRNISKAIVFAVRAIYMGWTATIVYDQNFFAIGFEEVQIAVISSGVGRSSPSYPYRSSSRPAPSMEAK